MQYEILIVAIILTAVYFDIRSGRIPNALIIFGLSLGLLKSALAAASGFGSVRLTSAILGLIFPVACLYLLFAIRAVGAGDIKLLAIIGFIIGIDRIKYIVLYSLFAGAVYGIFLIIIYRDHRYRMEAFFGYVDRCLRRGCLQSYTSLASLKCKSLYFSAAIGLGYLTELILRIL